VTKLVCISVPYWLGQKAGLPNSVAALQSAGVVTGADVTWVEVVADDDAASDPVTAVNKALAEAIAARPDRFPLIFAGDCLSCIGAVKGLERHQPGVLWYDAHGDFNTPATTLSHYLAGMSLAALVGRDNQHLLTGVSLTPIAGRDVVITDARDLDLEEGVNLRASDVLVLENVNQLLTAPLPDKPLYIHFDTDVVRIEDMPVMSYPAPGGPSVDDCIATLEHVIRRYPVAGMLFSLWNIDLPGSAVARQNTLRIVQSVIQALHG
jgi:arginase